MDCIYVPKKQIYIVIEDDVHYIFVGKYDATDKIVSDIMGKLSITNEHHTLLKKYYGATIAKMMTKKDSVLIKCFINLDDTIQTIKQKITTYIHHDIEPEKQHLWITKTKLNREDIDRVLIRLESNSDNMVVVDGNLTEYDVFLGIEYRNENGIKLINSDINILIESGYPDFDDNLYDVHSNILETYGRIKNNMIHLKTQQSSTTINPTVQKIYFPLSNDTNFKYDTFHSMINERTKTEHIYHNVVLNEIKQETHCEINNMVLKSNVNTEYFRKLDLNHIFTTFELDMDVPYIKYKNEYYRFFTKKQSKMGNRVTNNFKAPSKYIINYERGHYDPIISKENIIKWKKKQLSYREKQYLKEQRYYDLQFINRSMNDLYFKIVYDEDYYVDFVITQDGICYIRSYDMIINTSIFKTILQKCNSLIKKINGLTKYKLNNVSKNNMKFITIDSKYSINVPSVTIAKIKSQILNFKSFIYLESSDVDTLHLKYTKVNNFNTLMNFKTLFLKLKQATKNLNISQFEQRWKIECQNIFSVSEVESLDILKRILEQGDFKQISIDYEVDIIITNNYTTKSANEDNYTIDIQNCYSLTQLARIHEFIHYLLIESKRKRTVAVTATTNNLVQPVELKKIQMATEEDDMGLDDDFLDLESDDDEDEDAEKEAEKEEEIGAEEDIDIEQLQSAIDNDEEPVYEAEDETLRSKTHSIRNYMSTLRKTDPKLFKYKSTDTHESYSIKCGAVDMRQPIILTNTELKHFENKNPDGYKALSKLEWGSSVTTKNFYMCPRIWCIRDKIALTDKQLTDNKGKCPFCQGEIIDSQTKEIHGNQTIIIRRAGSNKYWANPDIYSKKSKEWQKLLYETEKEAYPGFLDPKLHPSGFCMPCCNSNKFWNYSKCFTIPVDFAIPNTQKNTIAIGDTIDEQVVKLNDTVLVVTDNNIYKITKNGLVPVTEFTKLKLPLQEGMKIKIQSQSAKLYKVVLDNNVYKFEEDYDKKAIVEDRYLLGNDKFPLPENKIGELPQSLDDMLDNQTQTKLYKSKLRNDVSLFTRRGIPQVPFNSFLCCMAYIKGITLKKLMENIIGNIEPDEYLSLNNGDVFKMFIKYDQTIKPEYEPSFKKWTQTYSNFANKYADRKVFLEQVFISMENYKHYCGDMNVQKEPIFFQDLLSKHNTWFFEKGINIIILERKPKEQIYLHLPQVDDTTSLYNNYENTCILYKYRGIYEPIIISQTTKAIPTFFNYYNASKNILDNTVLPRINNMINLVVSNGNYIEDNTIIYSKLNTIADSMASYTTKIDEEFRPQYFVYDDYNVGVGIALNNNVIIHTVPYGINRYSKLEKKHINTIKLIGSTTLKNKLDVLEIKYGNYVLDDGVVNGLMLENGYIHPIKNDTFDPMLDYAHINHAMENNEEFGTFILNHETNQRLYHNFKQELSMVFQTNTKSIIMLKNIVSAIIRNVVMPIHIRQKRIYEILTKIIDGITVNKNGHNIKTKKICGKTRGKPCSKSKKCTLITNDVHNKGFKLEIGENIITIKLPACRLNIVDKLKNKFTKILVNELVSSHIVRMEIFENMFMERVDMDTILTMNDDINHLYKGNNFYLVNNVKPIRPIFYVPDRLIKTIYDSNKLISKVVYATSITNTDKDMCNPNIPEELRVGDVKMGQCIFPFKRHVKGEVETYHQCVRHKNHTYGFTCATEVDANGFQTKYGFCNDKIQSVVNKNVVATDTSTDTSTDTAKIINPDCIFPFKSKGVEYNKCVKGKGNKPDWCAIKTTKEGVLSKWESCDTTKLRSKKPSSTDKSGKKKSQSKLKLVIVDK